MRLFDFFKSNNFEKPSIDLTDFKFLSDDHDRIDNGRLINADNKGAWRGIRIKTQNNEIFYVTMYNMNGNHPVWGNNIQMAEKPMKLIAENRDQIIFRGFGTDNMGASFADYGITLHKANGNVKNITLHMHDRKIDIFYKKGLEEKQEENLDYYSDFDVFKNFTHRWSTSMSMNEKMPIAMQSDEANNRGAEAYRNGDIGTAINYFEQALSVMPNNDDSLKNLKLCYSKTGDERKVNEVNKKLNYLSQ